VCWPLWGTGIRLYKGEVTGFTKPVTTTVEHRAVKTPSCTTGGMLSAIIPIAPKGLQIHD